MSRSAATDFSENTGSVSHARGEMVMVRPFTSRALAIKMASLNQTKSVIE
jgi:hypothetical protein